RCSRSVRGRALDLDAQQKAGLDHELDRLVQRWDPRSSETLAAPAARIQRPDVGPVHRRDRAVPVGRAVHGQVVEHREMAVPGELDVGLDPVRTKPYRLDIGLERLFRERRTLTAMRHRERRRPPPRVVDAAAPAVARSSGSGAAETGISRPDPGSNVIVMGSSRSRRTSALASPGTSASRISSPTRIVNRVTEPRKVRWAIRPGQPPVSVPSPAGRTWIRSGRTTRIAEDPGWN